MQDRAPRPRGGGLGGSNERLTEIDVRLLIKAFEHGTPEWKLAEQYGISVSSIKRLLRTHRS